MAVSRITARLLLTELDESYLDSIAEMMGDPRVNEYFYGFQRIKNSTYMPSYTSDYFFTPFANTRAEFGIGGFAIHERDASNAGESKFVGFTGFFPPTSHHPEYGPELVYILGAEFHGRGYAFEAADATITHAQEVTTLEWLSLTTDAPNRASRRVAEKLGFSEIGQVAAYGADDMVFYAKHLR